VTIQIEASRDEYPPALLPTSSNQRRSRNSSARVAGLLAFPGLILAMAIACVPSRSPVPQTDAAVVLGIGLQQMSDWITL
jgi:hypothetical protein